jgi:hypothetical protein
MQLNLLLRVSLVVLLIIFAVSCAKEGSPSGGPRDKTPPVVVRSVPVNGATGFTGKSVTISFDEFVTLDKIQEKFMVSPPTEKKPQVTLKGKNIVVDIDEVLRDSTTYTLYFQDAIRDLNEGNIIENYQFVFSTGTYIDSLSFSGSVYNAFDLEIPQNITVLLHSNLSDTAPQKSIPDYITRLNPDGLFTLNNLRAGTYRLYAIGDLNNNRRYETGSEPIAFTDTLISITPERHFVPPSKLHDHDTLNREMHDHDTLVADSHDRDTLITRRNDIAASRSEITLYTSVNPQQKYYLTSSTRKNEKLLEYYFSMPLDTFEFRFSAEGADAQAYFTEVNRNRDTFRIWITDSLLYSTTLIQSVITYPATDTSGIIRYTTDTIPMRFVQPRVQRVTAMPGVRLQANVSRAGIPPAQDIIISSDLPVAKTDFSRFSLSGAGDSTGVQLPFTPLFDPANPRIIRISQKLEEGKEYLLRILPGAVVSTYGDQNDTASFRFRVRPMDSYGTFAANVSGYEGKVILQLLDASERILMEQKGVSPGKFLFRFIENGTYRLKVIYDIDGNGYWTPGDFSRNRQPEPVSFFNSELEIKSNWDMVQEWNIENRNQKDNKLRKQVQTRR